jgi:hypothetical protein
MSRKFDAPFVEISCWIPFQWLEIWHLVKEHPHFQVALRDALSQILKQANSEKGGNSDV